MRILLVVAVALAAGCGIPLAKKCSTDSDCSSDAVCESGACRAVLFLEFRTPPSAATVKTNGEVELQLDVSGAAPSRLELFCDGAPLTELKAPYQYRWDTRPIEEGVHSITARAIVGSREYVSQPLLVEVDRTSPRVTSQVPAAGAQDVPAHSPISVDFSEPVVLPLGAPDAAAELFTDGGLRLGHQCNLSNGGTRLAIEISGEPEPPLRLTLALKDGITDLAGNPLELPPPASWRIPMRCNTDADCVAPEACRQGSCQPVNGTDCRTTSCTVALEAPAPTIHTNGSMTLQVGLTGAPPDKVELLVDGAPLATLVPPYRHVWDTRSVPEGSYQLTTRATQGTVVYFSHPLTVKVDRSPPVVNSLLPADGDQNVGVRSPILIRFSEPVRLPAGSAESVVQLTGIGGLAISTRAALSEDLQTLQIAYVLAPTVPADVALRILPGITDLAGNSLVPPAQARWHLPRWQRLGPSAIRTEQLFYGYDFDLDGAGHPTVAWGNEMGIGVARWNGTNWEQLGEEIRGPGSTKVHVPRIALKPSGEPVLAWTEVIDPRPQYLKEQIVVKQLGAGGWSYLGQNPIGPSEANTSQPSLAIGSDGGIWLGLREVGSAGRHSLVRRYDGSFYWNQQGGYLDRLGLEANGPKLAFDREDRLWAAWTESAGFGGIDNRTVFELFTSLFDSGSWSAVGGILNQDGNAPAYLGQLLPVPGGLPIITWAERMSGGIFKGWYRSSSLGGWGPADAAVDASFYSVAAMGVTGQGELYGVVSDSCRLYQKRPGQSTWTTGDGDRICERAEFLVAPLPVVRANASGEVLILWVEQDPVNGAMSLYLKRLNR